MRMSSILTLHQLDNQQTPLRSYFLDKVKDGRDLLRKAAASVKVPTDCAAPRTSFRSTRIASGLISRVALRHRSSLTMQTSRTSTRSSTYSAA